jgi:RNA polymerase sigma-70 factor (ECF subfamily)
LPQSRPPYLFGLPEVILFEQPVTLEQAFDQYHQAVFRFLYRLTRRPDVAEDLTQESFLVFLSAPGRFDPARGTVRTFLFAIARNLAPQQFRDYAAEEQWEKASDLTSAPDPRPGIEIGAAVAEAVASLAPLQREALILFEYEGLTLEEIAAVVAADAGTVKSRLHRARATLRRALAPYRNEGRVVHGTV